jgi:RHS repeat-associated protein
MGSLLSESTDGSGMQYKRNRYYDPSSGRFTQVDPIGLAGGLNAYGFGGGDQVNFSDPFGLCPPCTDADLRQIGADFNKRTAGLETFVSIVWGLESLFVPGGGEAAMTTLGTRAASGVEEANATVTVSRSRFPESAAHIEEAQAAGQPSTLTIDRAGAAGRRAKALRGLTPRAGFDRDEYPPALFREGGEGASVKYIRPGDNRGAGACIGAQCRALPDATNVRIKVIKE